MIHNFDRGCQVTIQSSTEEKQSLWNFAQIAFFFEDDIVFILDQRMFFVIKFEVIDAHLNKLIQFVGQK